ncbi:MAG TPA: DUF1329 domain-containing protein [Solimonas sp.]|nr:DUF1329 domain-containing protein [Solimonas sp.]
MSRRPVTFCVALLLGLAAPLAGAKVGADEASKLGKDLTPVGAEKAANKDGSIPAWAPAAQRGKALEYPTNPEFDAEKPLFTVTKANMAQYAAKLDEGHKKLLQTYDTYKMNVYKSHRNISFPPEILAATAANATTAELQSPDKISNAKLGFPFPIPKSGAEPIWNHRLKWRGENARRYNNQMIVQPSGEFQLTKIIEDVKFYYASIKNPLPAGPGAVVIKYLSQTIAPPRMAGTFILVHEKTDGRDAWLYSPGLKRIRRAPTVCCDNPYEGTDGHQFYDQVDMFNGTMERYNLKLVGKKEMYIAYNSNKIAGPSIKFKDLAKAKHLNQDLPRYELHRVWTVEFTIKPGTNHTFTKRVMYIDEDSWNIVAVEDYDSRGQLYQYQEGHLVFAYNILAATTVPEVIYHFSSGRYFVTAMANEDKAVDNTVVFDDKDFDAAAVQKRTTK